ncbi:DUF6234 family protein [Streptomyces sp. NPDC087901]|uniref:DUF6234 family protein n=1 Tax=Streptomyces sp. NPDC087901 TaxID=3365818 RepID=UPI00382FFAA8
MTHEVPGRAARGRWPWSRPKPLASDLASGIGLLVVEAVVFGWMMFGYGMEGWAAQGAREEMDESTLAGIAFMEHFLIGLFVLFGIAVLARARWTAILHLLTAGAVAALLVSAQHDYDRSHPEPAPTPSAGYSPCYSGSGRCD